MKIYLAGKWGDRKAIRKIMGELEEKGHEITHYWPTYGIPEIRTVQNLSDFANQDIEGVRHADIVVVLMTDPAYAYRGSFTEVGAALGMDKPLFIVESPDPKAYCKTNCFYYHPAITHVARLEDVPGLY